MGSYGDNRVLRRRIATGFAIKLAVILIAIPCFAYAQQVPEAACGVESVVFEGWQAQQLSNPWVKLVIVPQLGGRVMQVYFDGHPYLFVNPKYKGQYFPPSDAEGKHRWFNYGGDKIWPMPEGSQDEHHWPGPISDPLDDGNYAFKVLSASPSCKIRLDGPPDPKTGLQYSREITLESDSPEIRFHAIMKNIADHPIQWSMQSVTQYDTNDPQHPEDYNRDFWAFTPANSGSAYLDRYHVRAGFADDPSFRIRDGLFTVHWLPLENEVWLDSPAGWVAIVDASSQYGMVEHFHYFPSGEYPGKATVIFYKNGSVLEMNEQGFPVLNNSHPDEMLRYMEAELNSPIVTLAPGQTYAMDTKWNPVRVGRELAAVSDAGVCGVVLQAARAPEGIHLRGSFGVYFPGHLEAQLLDSHGAKLKSIPLQSVNVNKTVELEQTISAPDAAAKVSIHLIDARGRDRGTLGAAKIIPGAKSF
jgi:hypothetical protein